MSNILSILNAGVSGLFAAQAQIDTAGNNITNVDTEGYSRQRVVLQTSRSQVTANGVFGTGVTIKDVQQIYDSLLASTVRNENSDLSYYTTTQDMLNQVKIYFNELENGSGLGEAMSEYFNAWSDLANTATDQSDEASIKKQTVIEKAQTLTEKIQSSYSSLDDMVSSTNTQLKSYVTKINEITDNIGQLNSKIASIEATGVTANDLRDQRETLLNNLAQITNISISDRDNGQVAVFINGNALVDQGQVYKLAAVQEDGTDDRVSIIWNPGSSNNNVDITSGITSGQAGALLDMRDTVIPGYMSSLDKLASTLITQTNSIHAIGQGTEGLTQITSSNGVKNASYPLAEVAGAFNTTVNTGVLRITVYDSDGNVAGNLDIDIDPKTDTLNSVINKISLADGNPNGGMIQANLSQNNTLKITASSGYTFAFTEDTSNFLVASGTNGFFTGTGASDIAVSSTIANDVGYLATSLTGAAGDNQNAVNIANLKTKPAFSGTTTTLDGFYSLFAAGIATDKSNADNYVTTKKNTVNQFSLKLESVRGVSLDEELTDMMKFQRAYQASARFITVVDEMIDKLVNGLGTGGR